MTQQNSIKALGGSLSAENKFSRSNSKLGKGFESRGEMSQDVNRQTSMEPQDVHQADFTDTYADHLDHEEFG